MVGLTDYDSFGIGDTLTEDPSILYKEIPRFPPEAFAYLHNPNTARYKQFRQGLEQLLEEGVIQALSLRNADKSRCRCSAPSVRCNSRGRAIPPAKRIPGSRIAPRSRALGPRRALSPAHMIQSDLDALSLPTGAQNWPTTWAKTP